MAYMSQKGYDEMVAQLQQLETVERPKASAAIAEARDKGDLSENAEYDAAKEAQAHLETKINQLKLAIAEAKVIDTSRLSTEAVLAQQEGRRCGGNCHSAWYDQVAHRQDHPRIITIMDIFSKIAAGEIPSYKCAESEKFYAFLDINPVVLAHTLVIPRREVDYIFDMEDDELAEFEVFAKRVAKAIRTAFPCKKVAQVVLGLEVPHAHIHLLPINSEGDVDFHRHVQLSEEEMKATAEKILAAFNAQ